MEEKTKNPSEGLNGQENKILVQSILPQEDVVALKLKTKEPHIKEAIARVVYCYLKQENIQELNDDKPVSDNEEAKEARGRKIIKYVHIQGELPQGDVIALKVKTKEDSVKEAISKAIYWYLK